MEFKEIESYDAHSEGLALYLTFHLLILLFKALTG